MAHSRRTELLDTADFFHGCHACGQCCDSPPQATLPELFRHEELFVGCLAVRLIPRRPTLARTQPGSGSHANTEELDRLHRTLLHRPRLSSTHDVLLTTRAFDYASTARCPQLTPAGLCAIHTRKPQVCRTVPYDALLPDSWQALTLSSREKQSQLWGADCIRSAPKDGLSRVVHRLRLVDTEAQKDLTARREQLSRERRFWGDTLYEELSAELFDHPARLAQIPEHGDFLLSLAPVLLIVARASTRAHARVLDYAHAQRRTQEQLIEAALSRKNRADREDTALLRRFIQANQALIAALTAGPPPQRHDPELEAWLGGALGPRQDFSD